MTILFIIESCLMFFPQIYFQQNNIGVSTIKTNNIQNDIMVIIVFVKYVLDICVVVLL